MPGWIAFTLRGASCTVIERTRPEIPPLTVETVSRAWVGTILGAPAEQDDGAVLSEPIMSAH